MRRQAASSLSRAQRAAQRGVASSSGASAAGTEGGTSAGRRRSALSAAKEVGAPGSRAQGGLSQAVVVESERLVPFVPSKVRPTAVPASVRVAVAEPSGFRNVDGGRIEDGRYAAFQADIASFIPAERVITDSVRTFAYGTDASFYRLNPRVVVKISSEEEARRILPLALKHRTPVTIRAAGTSLSGQAVTDSVMLKLSHGGKAFRNYEIKARACGLRGARGTLLRLRLTVAPHLFLHRREAGSSQSSRASSAVR